jgi:hypothetical protein
VSALSKFLSKENEPVRLYLYGVAFAVLALLGAVGVLTGSVAVAVGGVVAAALIVPAVPALRSKVTPVPASEVLESSPENHEDI